MKKKLGDLTLREITNMKCLSSGYGLEHKCFYYAIPKENNEKE